MVSGPKVDELSARPVRVNKQLVGDVEVQVGKAGRCLNRAGHVKRCAVAWIGVGEVGWSIGNDESNPLRAGLVELTAVVVEPYNQRTSEHIREPLPGGSIQVGVELRFANHLLGVGATGNDRRLRVDKFCLPVGIGIDTSVTLKAQPVCQVVSEFDVSKDTINRRRVLVVIDRPEWIIEAGVSC